MIRRESPFVSFIQRRERKPFWWSCRKWQAHLDHVAQEEASEQLRQAAGAAMALFHPDTVGFLVLSIPRSGQALAVGHVQEGQGSRMRDAIKLGAEHVETARWLSDV